MEQPPEIMGLQRRAEANAQTIEWHQAVARSKEWRERAKKELTAGSSFIHRISKWRTTPLPVEGYSVPNLELADPHEAADRAAQE
eukprot:4986780-Pyramimonas_sp.AAC.1